MDTNTAISLMLLLCTTPFLIVALALLWLGPMYWPVSIRKQWYTVPQQTRKIVVRLLPVAWLLIGVFVGSSMVNPVARWLSALTH